MHCLYCDRPLALLKRLTGDGEFCSKEHRKIYQREHNQLALERLLEAQPVSNRKSTANQPKREATAPAKVTPAKVVPLAPPPPPPEPVPELADFSALDPPEAALDSSSVRLSGDPYPIGVVPIWTSAQSAKERTTPQPRAAEFQSEQHEPRALAADVRLPQSLDFTAGEGHPIASSILFSDTPVPRQLGAAGFVDPKSATAQSIPERVAGVNVEPSWKPFEPAIPGRFGGRIVLVFGAFLERPAPAPSGPDALPDIFEIRLQPISFPPLTPRMASLEERLHRTDRIGFCPP